MLDKASIRIDIFLHSLSSLEDNLTGYLITTTSNMLALNYAVDRKLREVEPNAHKYADLCAGRIKNFLKDKVILDETFDIAVEIFAVAITPEIPNTEDLPGMNKMRDQEKTSEVIVMAALGSDLPDQELALLNDVVDVALGMPDANDIIGLIGGKPDMIMAILKSKNRKSNQRNAKEIAHELSQLAKNALKARSIISDFAQLAGLLASAAMAFVGNMMAVHSFEAIAAAVVIPVSVITLKYGASLGEKLGAKIAEFEGGVKLVKSEIKSIIADSIPAIDPALGIVVQSVSKQEIVELVHDKIELGNIAKSLVSHIDTVSTEIEIEKIQKSLRQRHKDGRTMERG